MNQLAAQQSKVIRIDPILDQTQPIGVEQNHDMTPQFEERNPSPLPIDVPVVEDEEELVHNEVSNELPTSDINPPEQPTEEVEEVPEQPFPRQ